MFPEFVLKCELVFIQVIAATTMGFDAVPVVDCSRFECFLNKCTIPFISASVPEGPRFTWIPSINQHIRGDNSLDATYESEILCCFLIVFLFKLSIPT